MVLKTIDSAILAHQIWVARFETALKGINTELFDIGLASDSSVCAFGKWLGSNESIDQLGADTHHQVTMLHSNFHQVAGEVARNLNQVLSMQETQEWMEEFRRVSRQLVLVLMEAKRKKRSSIT